MNPFVYVRARGEDDAIQFGAPSDARYIAGGTNLVDLMRETIERPSTVVDVTGLSAAIEERTDGSIMIGAAARNTAVAEHLGVRARYPMVARAIVAGASAQIRNMATIGGNILQRTRCAYFYDQAARCNKRRPGSGCDAIDGFHRTHAILGTSMACIAAHPSDLCVALAALDAIVHLRSSSGTRRVPFTALHLRPGETPEQENVLQPGELVVAIELPALTCSRRSTYRKVRDRASYAFALVSVAAALELDGDTISEVRIALGGVGTVPWRAWKAESKLRGGPARHQAFAAAMELELEVARPLAQNAFKVELAKRTAAAVLGELAEGAK